jgi:MFS family permease
MSPAGAKGSGRVLAILLLAYIFNFVDRQIVGILAVPIKTDLGLSDTQLGLMGGLAFALFYTGLGIPVAWLADRVGRARVIAASVAIWSLFTALCGFAQNFTQLFLARMGVGIGEAGGVAPSYALISDYFPPERRARALAIFSFGIPIGSALGIFFGGWIATRLDWRAAFIIVGLAGLLVVPLVKLGVPEPRRLEGAPAAPAFGVSFRLLTAKPSFWLISFAAGLGSIPGYGLLFWLPSFLGRSFGLDLVAVSLFFGTIVLGGGVCGIWLGGWFADKAARRTPAAYPMIPATCFILAAPIYAMAMSSSSPTMAFLLFLVPQALSLAWLGPVVTALQHLVPAEMRATAAALFLFINNLVGIGIGTLFFGFMSDLLAPRFGTDSLRYALLIGLGFYLVSAALYLLTARRLPRDVETQ